MADPETIALLDKLKTMAANNGIEIDSDRMIRDMDYASQVLLDMGDTHDQIQGLVVMQLLKQLGLQDWSDGMSE